MAKTNLAHKLINDYPDITFEKGDDFCWSPRSNTVYYRELITTHDNYTLLHELAHGLLGHQSFSRDIALLQLERSAWTYAQQMAPNYGLSIGDDIVEKALDTYRDWLYLRSSCPSCAITGVQTALGAYRCPGCEQSWRVNDARRCSLRRYAMQTT